MGYGLLYESMLPTLIHARDRFLAPGGAVLPSACSLLLVGSSHNRLAFFDDVYGLSPPRDGMRLLVVQLERARMQPHATALRCILCILSPQFSGRLHTRPYSHPHSGRIHAAGFSFTPIAEPIRAEAAVEIVPEDTVRCSRDAAEVRLRCSRGAAEVFPC